MLKIGDSIAGHEIIAKLGAGGMATLFLGRKRSMGGFSRLSAIKVVHGHLSEDQNLVDLFLDEARLSARIEHPNVVQVTDVGEENKNYYMVMEYISGVSLAQLLAQLYAQKKRLAPEIAVYIAAQVAAGLHAAHELTDDAGNNLGVVHRDISPSNVLIGFKGQVKLIDFGIAKAADRSQQTQGMQLKGKFGYMSPEQAEAESVDRRADVYALAIVLWEMLTTQRRFAGGNDAKVLLKVRDPSIRPPSQKATGVTDALDQAVMHAMHKNKELRTQTSEDFGKEILKAVPQANSIGSQILADLVGVVMKDSVRNERSSINDPTLMKALGEPQTSMEANQWADRFLVSSVENEPPPLQHAALLAPPMPQMHPAQIPILSPAERASLPKVSMPEVLPSVIPSPIATPATGPQNAMLQSGVDLRTSFDVHAYLEKQKQYETSQKGPPQHTHPKHDPFTQVSTSTSKVRVVYEEPKKKIPWKKIGIAVATLCFVLMLLWGSREYGRRNKINQINAEVNAQLLTNQFEDAKGAATRLVTEIGEREEEPLYAKLYYVTQLLKHYYGYQDQSLNMALSRFSGEKNDPHWTYGQWIENIETEQQLVATQQALNSRASPENGNPIFILLQTEVMIKRGEVDKARQLIAKHPSGWSSWQNIQLLESNFAKDAEIKSAITALLKMIPKHAKARIALAKLERKTGNDATAERLLKEAMGSVASPVGLIEPSPRERSLASWEMGFIFEKQGRLSQAENHFREGLLIPQLVNVSKVMVGSTLVDSQPFEAVRFMEEALKQKIQLPLSVRLKAYASLGDASLALYNFDKASDAFLEGKKEEKSDKTFWDLKLANALIKAQKPEDAKKILDQLKPDSNPVAHQLLAASLARNSGNNVLEILAKAKSAAGNNTTALFSLGSWGLNHREFEFAKDAFTALLKENPTFAAALYGLSESNLALYEISEAKKNADELFKLDSGFRNSCSLRARILKAQGDLESAMNVLLQQSLCGNNPKDALTKSELHLAMGQIELAEQTLHQAQQHGLHESDAAYGQSQVFRAREKYEQALKSIDRALTIDPKRPDFLLEKAKIHLELGSADQTISLSSDALAVQAIYPEALYVRAQAFLKNKNVAGAIADLQSATQQNPDNASYQVLMASAFDAQGKTVQAIEALESAVTNRSVKSAPGDWWLSLARLLVKVKRIPDALRSFSKATLWGDALGQTPKWLADAHKEYGNLLRTQNDKSGAVQHYRRYLQLAPDSPDRHQVRELMLTLGASS